MQARYIQRGESIDFLPDRDIAAGEIVIRNGLIGVARIPVKKGTLGSLALSGVFDVTKPVRSLTEVERLGAYLKYASDEEYQDYVRQILSEEDMDMTENTYRKVSQDELEYERREARLKYQLQYNTEISVAREQGLAQGLKKGEAAGLKKGEAVGLKKGEAQKQREIAKNLKALNLTKEQIAEATGLSAAEIEKL